MEAKSWATISKMSTIAKKTTKKRISVFFDDSAVFLYFYNQYITNGNLKAY